MGESDDNSVWKNMYVNNKIKILISIIKHIKYVLTIIY